jgi:phosphoenolpyruvate carboxykinase (GTP)
MKPFCGYNMADYFQHWFDMGDRLGKHAPRIFYVNWFRKTADGKWLWPGYGENSRVLEWMCERVDGKASARQTPIGHLPDEADLDMTGLDLPSEDLRELLRVDEDAWRHEVSDIEKHFAQFGTRLPARLRQQLDELEARLG